MRCVRDATGWTTYLEPHEIPAVETLYANMKLVIDRFRLSSGETVEEIADVEWVDDAGR